MSATIKIEIDGKSYDRSECSWFEWAPCGCLVGVALADYLPLDEDAAWREFHGTKREVDRRRRKGHRFVLRPHSELPNPWDDCHHVPRWVAS